VILAFGGAPLTTCKAAAAIPRAQASVLCKWLMVAKQKPLLAAVRGNLWDICCQLLAEGHKPAREDMRFALVKAAAVGHERAVASLLGAGACKAPKGKEGAEVVKAGSLAFNIAAEWNRVAICRLLLERKVPLNPGTLDGALKSAARNPQSIQLLQLLLEKGKDINIGKDRFTTWKSPLAEAISTSNAQGVRVLLQHGASAQYVAAPGGSALHHAVLHRASIEVVRLLVQAGARDGDDLAVKEGMKKARWDIVELLMQPSK
jgi:hypothetical protein